MIVSAIECLLSIGCGRLALSFDRLRPEPAKRSFGLDVPSLRKTRRPVTVHESTTRVVPAAETARDPPVLPAGRYIVLGWQTRSSTIAVPSAVLRVLRYGGGTACSVAGVR